MIAPQICPGCGAQVIEAIAGERTVLLDYGLAPKGAVAARVDPDTETWQARYLQFGEDHDQETEVRFRQHETTCKTAEKGQPDA